MDRIYWNNDLSNYIDLAREAKHPFQFLSHSLAFVKKDYDLMTRIPISHDASASAYQIMSYFLLDKSIAERTNLFPSFDGKIKDIYSFFLYELKVFMKEKAPKEYLTKMVCNLLSRKIVKSIYMPIIYGKTLMSTANDLEDLFSYYITRQDSFKLAKVFFEFWKTKYSGIECLIKLIRHIGWVVSARGSPVFYGMPDNIYTTVQDYMVSEPSRISIYDKNSRKRRLVTLRISTSKRDRRKTEIATFVNFIHQKDAYIAMNVVKDMFINGGPIYTVHDNFITTSHYSHLLPNLYSNVFINMKAPLLIINHFIYTNIIFPILAQNQSENFKTYIDDYKTDIDDYMKYGVISMDVLSFFLKENIPENTSGSMLATWDKRISGILSSYEEYISYVCGGTQFSNQMELLHAHNQKCSEFKRNISDGVGPNYCLHY